MLEELKVDIVRAGLQVEGGGGGEVVAAAAGDTPVSISQIARAEGLSPEYAAKLLRILREGGLIVSVRGAGGGYKMARPPSEITMWEAVEVLDGAAAQHTEALMRALTDGQP